MVGERQPRTDVEREPEAMGQEAAAEETLEPAAGVEEDVERQEPPPERDVER
jgi:hypothetical protein